MNWVSILGLFTLLGIAWALSYHRTKVRIRIVVWGLGLQLVLALIILREDVWSYIGMALLGLLLVSYMLRQDHARLGGAWISTGVLAAAGLAIGFGFASQPSAITR